MSIINCCSSVSGQSDNSVGIQKEALKEMIMHILHHELKPDIEGLFRNIVREEFGNLLNGLDRNSGYQMQTSEPRHLKLQFLKNVSPQVFTNEEIQGEDSSSIELALIDNLNEKFVDSGPEASAKVEIVALEGDVGGTKGDDLTSEVFNEKIVREREDAYSKGKKKRREGNKPLLGGDVHLRLNKGIGAIGKIKFRQYQCWMKNRKFKLGARILDSFAGVRIKEAVTKPFIVKDCRNKSKRKRGPPSLMDDVSTLKNIRKDGRLHKHLQEKNINTVEDFLIQLFRNPEHLEQILGLEANLWEDTVNHAQKCALDKRISYYYSSQEKLGVVFNVIEQELGLISDCKYSPIEDRSEKDKADARRLAVTAFDHWEDVLHFDDTNSLLEYVHNLPATKETSNPPTLQIPGGNCTSFQDITAFDHWEDVLHLQETNSLLEYVHNLPATKETSNPPTLQIPGGNCTSFQDITAFDHWEDVLHFNETNSLLEYVHNLPATKESSNPPPLQIPGGNCTSLQDICWAPGTNVENIHSPDSSRRDYRKENFGNRYRKKKAIKIWKKLSIAVRISVKK